MAASVTLMALAGMIDLREEPVFPSEPAGPAVSWNGTCPTTQLVMTGAYVGCTVIKQVEYCPRSFEQAKVIRLRGVQADFLLYIEIYGPYHGVGTYQLRPWPHPGLGENDGVAKVAVREYDSGQYWQSVSGWLTVDAGERSGALSTGLGKDPVLPHGHDSAMEIDLNLAGRWSCV